MLRIWKMVNAAITFLAIIIGGMLAIATIFGGAGIGVAIGAIACFGYVIIVWIATEAEEKKNGQSRKIYD